MDLSAGLTDRFIVEHPLQAATVLEAAPAPEAAALLAELDDDLATSLLLALGPVAAANVLAQLPGPRQGSLVGRLPVDRAGALLRRLGTQRAEAVIAHVPGAKAKALRHQLGVVEDSVGVLTDPQALAFPEDTPVQDLKDQLASVSQPYVYVLSRGDEQLAGVVGVRDLWTAKPEQPVGAIMGSNVMCLRSSTHLTRAAEHPGWREYDTLPVVDSRERFVGTIRHRALRRWLEARGATLAAGSPLDTITRIGELYVIGLAAVLKSLARNQPPPAAP